jgi:hypothetical protein
MRDSNEIGQTDRFDDLDKMIDAALATYGDPGTDNGLEERMLRGVRKRVTNQSAPHLLRWLAWSAALAVAACVLALVFFSSRPTMRPVNNGHQAGTKEQPQTTDAVIATAPMPAAGDRAAGRAGNAVAIHTTPLVSAETSTAQPLPKLDVFPTPEPADEKVQALAFFVRAAPASEVKELLAKQDQADAPLAFNELEIPPLEPLDEGGR